jgi:GNAT superfamily N-acetyltransferase
VTDVSDLEIRPLDPTDDADMDGFQDVYVAAERAEDPDVALYSREDGIAMMTSTDSSALFEAFGAFRDGRMVGESILMGSHRDNLNAARLLLWVDPSEQRQGYGGHLLAHMEDYARTLGRTLMRSQSRIGEGLSHNRSFAEHHGYTVTLTEIERRLSLPAEPTLVKRLAAESAPYHEDYEVRSFVGRVPDELRASYVELRNRLEVEAPHGVLELEPGGSTVDDFEGTEREREEAGRTTVAAFALRDGVVVAYADASVPSSEFPHVNQFGTLVHPDHRGHRLGMAVKCAQLQLLSEAFPDKQYIETTNAETNAQMVAINVALGFEIHQVWAEFAKDLAPVEPG